MRTQVKVTSPYEEILRRILQDGIEERVFSMPDVRVATYAILAMLTGLTAWYQEGGRLSKEALIACYSKLITTGVGDTAQEAL